MALRLLHLEDDPNDRALVADVLRANGVICTLHSATTRESFEAALGDAPDLILADLSLPGFDGITAQAIAQARCPDVPFVFVSGSMGEEAAVERLKDGATDYVLKHHLEKLPSAVKRAIREAEDRRQRRRAEQDLQQLNAELQLRVTERTAALKATNDALERARLEADRANRAKSDFLSRMSHDLRTPLNAIMGFAQMLELDPLNADQADSVRHIIRGGRHLLGLINEVLDIARVEAGRLSVSPEPVGGAETLRDAIELIRPLAAQRGLAIEMGLLPDMHVFADRQRLSQILLNLLSNAVKYNREHGTIRASLEPRGSDQLAFVVSDTGAGIPAAKLALLFTPFERLGAEQTSVEGTGLGLALSKGLAEAMGGTIEVESVVDVGTTFRLTLPTASPETAVRGEASDTIAEDRQTNGMILYVEDNLANVLLMRRLMTRRPGVELVNAAGGKVALDIIRQRKPDLVFLDLHLPDLSGEEVLRQIWENPETRRIPVVVLTADATPSGQRRLLASGAMTFMTKPFDIQDVLGVIDRVLRVEAREQA